jgi:GTP:adenosylcobinamide-phosphate guanylyltransferase
VSARRYTALVLAGSRGGTDPVASAAGVTHKALATAGGVPLITRVLDALRSSAGIGDILVATDDPDVAALAGNAGVVPTAASPSLTVAHALRTAPTLMVTTADHALLSRRVIETFCAGVPGDCDVAAGVVPRRVLAAMPTRRTFYRLADEAYCGANLYAFVGVHGAAAAGFWAALEADRKRPWRIAARIGPSALVRYAANRLDLAAAFALLSGRAGATIAPVILEDTDAAIDVDTMADLEAVRARLSGSRRCDRSP